jgi:Zn-dependent peptidase ImmA (M78 family)
MDYSSIKIPFMKEDEIRLYADNFRATHWDGNIPVEVELIAELNGISLVPANGLRLLVNQEAWLSNDLSEIVFDPDVNDVRIRFSIAHELGHFKLHSKLIPILKPTSYEDWKSILDGIPRGLWSSVEYQADEFAGRLLVPRTSLIQFIKEDYLDKVKKAYSEIGESNFQILYPYLANSICKKFNVSHKMMLIRLQREEITFENIIN